MAARGLVREACTDNKTPKMPPRPPVAANYATAAVVAGFVGGVFYYCTNYAVRQENISQSDLDDYRARLAEKQDQRALAKK
eukprot:scaffold11398_cov108-Isochrysis_galbana.AAC.4